MASNTHTPHRLLVYGGTDYNDPTQLDAMLTGVRRRWGISMVIEGEAPGADSMSRSWAQLNGIPVWPFFADWNLFGDRAGPIRNARMLRESVPTLGVGFPGRTGTADMTRRLVEARVPTFAGRWSGGFGSKIEWRLLNG